MAPTEEAQRDGIDRCGKTRPISYAGSIALAAATVVAWIVLAALDHDGAGWLILPVLGVATALTAWRAGGTSPKNRGAFAGFIIGVLAIVVFIAFVIADAVS